MLEVCSLPMNRTMAQRVEGRVRQARIPVTLQAVFLASNMGKEVHKPPPEQAANKVYFRTWLFQGRNNNKNTSVDRKAPPRNNSGRNALKKLVMFGRKKLKNETLTLQDAKQALNKASETDSESTVKEAVELLQPEAPIIVQCPQNYLDCMLRSRGYSTMRLRALQSPYYRKPTPLQLASYDVHLIQLIRNGDEHAFRTIMESGVSLNPCNDYGESLLHTVCRRGDINFLKIMLECGSELKVADDYGRTPLHDACWSSTLCFEIIELLLDRDLKLLYMGDSRGAVPLSYVHREHWKAWNEWLESKKDVYWPSRDSLISNESDRLALMGRSLSSQPIPDPENALTPELARLVASGRMRPHEARFLIKERKDDITADESFSDDSESLESFTSFHSDSDFSYDDSDESESDSSEISVEVDELVSMLGNLARPVGSKS